MTTAHRSDGSWEEPPPLSRNVPQSLGFVQSFAEQRLVEFLADRRREADRLGPQFAEVVEGLSALVLGSGKRVRPAFAWLGWLGAGGDAAGPDAGAVQRVCAALELLQAGLLVHDDIIDQSDLRRGEPSLHRRFEAEHSREGWSGDAARHGEALAILAGELAFVWADDLAAEGLDAVAGADRTAFRKVWSAMRAEVIGGQCLDVLAQAGDDESEEAATRVIRWKTASYTVARPLELGGVLACANESLLTFYRSFGDDVGVAFQLHDDLLGVFGDPAVTGKPAGDDVREGKRTVLMALALRSACEVGKNQEQALRSAFGRGDDDASVAEAVKIIDSLGVRAQVRERIELLRARAAAGLEAVRMPAAAKAGLVELTASLLS
ncbi:Polyprenyl synthetase [Segniliparus rotundus DSM 44985]|uniref:Polyprenyl synthetase n=1 Tax=Segniliparus rotundus (strain ATCC BAA-972 / CDC 1076 / CIP 108378 / DSM 44985 / JCM 13578) TaxID=640132 RepID=D6ZF22_SEGRD|nr:polyprenyl synthetase family protein [Segniliparus rotundus]ADG97546.1 Polyprenyl synthetase [Segniliparus rotundus DSM 44985]